VAGLLHQPPNLEDQVIFDQGFLPLALDTPVSNCKAAVLVLVPPAAITKLNSILWDRDVTPKTKTHIYHAVVKSTITHGAETGCLKAKTLAKLNSTEIDFWRRSARISMKDKIRNTIINLLAPELFF